MIDLYLNSSLLCSSIERVSSRSFSTSLSSYSAAIRDLSSPSRLRSSSFSSSRRNLSRSSSSFNWIYKIFKIVNLWKNWFYVVTCSCKVIALWNAVLRCSPRTIGVSSCTEFCDASVHTPEPSRVGLSYCADVWAELLSDCTELWREYGSYCTELWRELDREWV